MTMPRPTFRSAILLAALATGPALAQDGDAEGRLVVELNAAEATAEGCSLSFLLVNTLPERIDSLILEAVLFDPGGQVERLTLFDFGALPAGRPRVRQFVLGQTECSGIASILINGAETCDIGGTGSDACESMLETRTRADIDLIG
jgi:hypothetical protein